MTTFLRIAEMGSITKAARSLGLSLPMTSQGVDIAIRAAAPPDRASLVARELATYRRVVCAAPSFFTRYGPIESLAALASVPCVIHGCWPAIWEFETPEGDESISVDGPLCSNNVVIIRDAVIAGVGVAWLPDYAIDEELKDGRLVEVLPKLKLRPIQVYGIIPRQARGNAIVKGILDVVSASLQAQSARFQH